MSLIKTNSGRITLKKAESFMVVPYVYDSAYGLVLGEDVYDITAIIGDTISVEPSEPDKTTKNNEFKKSPLVECFDGGEYSLKAQCIDIQNKVLKSLFGLMVSSSIEGLFAVGDDFLEKHALVRIRFKDASSPDIIIPNLSLSSRLLIKQLKTNFSEGNIEGVCLPSGIAVIKTTVSTACQFTDSASGETVYSPYSPMVSVPRGYTFLLYDHDLAGTNNAAYASVNFTTGSVSKNIALNKSTGVWSVISPNQGDTGGSGGGGNN